MAKGKTSVFFCQECGYESAKWMGQCPACKEWNTFVEETIDKKSISSSGKVKKESKEAQVLPLSAVKSEKEERIVTGIAEFDRVLGGGIVRGSLVLVGGDPGIGKSTLLLQVCRELSQKKVPLLYVSGEESLHQIKMRADRLGDFTDSLELLCETSLDIAKDVIQRKKPEVVVIDSIQTMYNEEISSAPGSVSQVRETTGVLMQLAKTLGISVFIVGHVTKDGAVAGPRTLEHMVDTVLYFEGDRYESYRILRGVKNRFGSTNEIGVFEMKAEGLVEVENPSEYMLSGKPEGASGSIVTCSIEGSRPILLEIQALVCHSFFNNPRRTANGTDYNKVNLLMAVLEKRANLSLSDCDAYVNIAGGIRMNEPAIDLGIVLAIASSKKDIIVREDTICFGEVGLSGEVRGVTMSEQRVAEAKKLGFKKCIVPKVCLAGVSHISGIEIVGVANIKEAILALQTYYVQPEIYELGRVTDDFYGVKLSVYDRERTICDCFKYRSRLNHEIFSKALNAYAKDEKKNLQNLSIYAKKLRVYKKVNELMSVLLDG